MLRFADSEVCKRRVCSRWASAQQWKCLSNYALKLWTKSVIVHIYHWNILLTRNFPLKHFYCPFCLACHGIIGKLKFAYISRIWRVGICVCMWTLDGIHSQAMWLFSSLHACTRTYESPYLISDVWNSLLKSCHQPACWISRACPLDVT